MSAVNRSFVAHCCFCGREPRGPDKTSLPGNWWWMTDGRACCGDCGSARRVRGTHPGTPPEPQFEGGQPPAPSSVASGDSGDIFLPGDGPPE